MHDIFTGDIDKQCDNAEPRLGYFGWSDGCCWIFAGVWERYFDPTKYPYPKPLIDKQGELL